MRTPIILLGCFSLALTGCDKGGGGPVNIADYPMGAGTTWAYHRTMSTYNFRPVKGGSSSYRDTVIQEDLGVEILGSVILRDSIHTVAFKGTSPYGTDVSYYRISDNTLLLVAYQHAGATFILPKRHIPYRYSFHGRSFSSLEDLSRFIEHGPATGDGPLADSITYEQHPPAVLVFPLTPGRVWAYRAYGDPGPKMEKRVLFQENITTPAGIIPTYRIQLLSDWNNTGAWDTTWSYYDNVGPQGLLRRTMLVLNLAVTSESDPEPVGYIDMRDEHDLTSMKIK